jgi:hypothetical protein
VNEIRVGFYGFENDISDMSQCLSSFNFGGMVELLFFSLMALLGTRFVNWWDTEWVCIVLNFVQVKEADLVGNMVGPTTYVRGGSTHLMYSRSIL